MHSYFKQRFYRPVTVLESRRGCYISLLEIKANPQYGKISLCINQCWNSLNLINVLLLTNGLRNLAYGKVIWFNEVKFCWRHNKTIWGRNPVYLYLSCILGEKTYKEYNGVLILGHSYVSTFLPFCTAGDLFYGAFKLQKLHQCALFCRCIVFFFLWLSDHLQRLTCFINDLLSKGWLI